MRVDRAVIFFCNESSIDHVIVVLVCQQQCHWLDTLGLQPIRNSVRCINKNPPLWRFKHVTIRLRHSTCENFVVRYHTYPFQRFH